MKKVEQKIDEYIILTRLECGSCRDRSCWPVLLKKRMKSQKMEVKRKRELFLFKKSFPRHLTSSYKEMITFG